MDLFQNFKFSKKWFLNPVFILFIFICIFYFFNINDFLTEDSIDYANSILKAPLSKLAHPHHLLYNYFARLFVFIFNIHFPSRDSLIFLQILNIFITIFLLIQFYYLLKEFKNSKNITLFLLIIISFSYSIIKYSSQIEVYSITALLLIISLRMLFKNKHYAWVFIVLAMLFHQTAIFLLFGVFLYGIKEKKNISFYLKNIALPLVIAGVIYIFFIYLNYGDLSFSNSWRYIFKYARSGYWGKVSLMNFPKLAIGFIGSLIPLDSFLMFIKSGNRLNLINVNEIITILLIIDLCIILFWVFYVILKKGIRAVIIAAESQQLCILSWVLAHIFFVFYWYPNNIEFWIPILPGLVILVGGFFDQKISKMIALFLYLFLLGEIATGISQSYQLHRSKNMLMVSTIELTKYLRQDDCILVSGQGAEASYLRYYLKSNVFSLQEIAQNIIDEHKSAKWLNNYIKKEINEIFIKRNKWNKMFITEELKRVDIVKYRSLSTIDLKEFLSFIHKFNWKEIIFKHKRLFLLAPRF